MFARPSVISSAPVKPTCGNKRRDMVFSRPSSAIACMKSLKKGLVASKLNGLRYRDQGARNRIHTARSLSPVTAHAVGNILTPL